MSEIAQSLYNPSDDPRFLGDDPEELEAAEKEIAFVEERLMQELDDLNRQIELFDDPRWAYVTDHFEEMREAAVTKMLTGQCKGVEQYEHERTRASVCKELVDLPDERRRRRESVISALEELRSSQSSEAR